MTNGEPVLYEYNDQGNWDVQFLRSAGIIGQTFTIGTVGPNENFTLTNIQLHIKKQGNPGDLVINMYDTDQNGDPAGSPLSNGILLASETPQSKAWVTVQMTSCVLYKRKQYAFTMQSVSLDDTNKYMLSSDLDAPDTYTGGCLIDSWNAGKTWGRPGEGAWDCYFKIYGIPLPPSEIPWALIVGGIIAAGIIIGGFYLYKKRKR